VIEYNKSDIFSNTVLATAAAKWLRT